MSSRWPTTGSPGFDTRIMIPSSALSPSYQLYLCSRSKPGLSLSPSGMRRLYLGYATVTARIVVDGRCDPRAQQLITVIGLLYSSQSPLARDHMRTAEFWLPIHSVRLDQAPIQALAHPFVDQHTGGFVNHPGACGNPWASDDIRCSSRLPFSSLVGTARV